MNVMHTWHRAKVTGLVPSIFSIVFLCSLFSIASAQEATIHGAVKEGVTPLEFVTLSLYRLPDTVHAFQYTTTDSTGSYAFHKIQDGNYILSFRLVGYHLLSLPVKVNMADKNIALPDQLLVRDEMQLQQVTVSAQKKLIERTNTGFVVNAASNITQAGGTATDLLRNTPTVTVDAEGAITLRGKAPLILVNGRNSALTNPDQIPASSIETIEIINNADARFDANAESGIINIKLKKNKQNGTNAAIAVGTGMGSRGRVSSSLLLNHKEGKLNIGLSYDNRFAGRTRQINASRTNYFLPDNYLLNQFRDDKRLEQLQNLKLTADYSISKRDQLSLELVGTMEGQDNNETLNSLQLKQNNNFVFNTSRNSIEIERNYAAEMALVYEHKYTDDRRTLSASITSSPEDNKQNTDITSQDLTKDYIANGAPFLQRTHNYENQHITEARLDHSIPVGITGKLEMGYKGLFRVIRSDFATSDKLNGSYVINTAATNIFHFNEQVNAAYLQLHGSFGDHEESKWKYHLGLRAEQVNNDGQVEGTAVAFSNKYLKLFPSVQFVYQPQASSSWKIGYNKRINRPRLGQLNPFTDITDSLSPHSGNPNLQPEIIHAVEAGYGYSWKGGSFTSGLFYRYSQNSIRNYYQLLPNGAVLNKPVNIGNAVLYGWENMVSASPIHGYDFNASVTIFNQRYNGGNVNTDAQQEGWSWNGKIINNLSLLRNSKWQITGNYIAAEITPQGNRIAQYSVDMGFQQKLGKGNTRLGITITDLLNTLKSGYNNYASSFMQYRYSKADTRAIMVTFACTFRSAFKEKLLENKFSAEY